MQGVLRYIKYVKQLSILVDLTQYKFMLSSGPSKQVGNWFVNACCRKM